MLPYNQISGRTEQPPETLTLTTCTRRASDFEKRFCFDLTFEQKPGITFTFQALSEEDRKVWLNAMDGKEPVSTQHLHFLIAFFSVDSLSRICRYSLFRVFCFFCCCNFRHIWHLANRKIMKNICWMMLDLHLPANALK